MITMKIAGKFLEAIKGHDKVIRELQHEAVKEASTVVWNQTTQNAPFGSSGQLRKGIRREVFPTKATITPSSEYAVAVHGGTAPHAVSKSALIQGGSLYRWAKKRGMNVYAVANSIKKKGTKANPFMANSIKETASEVQDIFKRILGKATQKLGGE